MVNHEQNPDLKKRPSKKDRKFEVELQNVPIRWDLENGTLSFFGIDSALFWTNPSLVNMLAPLAEEVGNDLFRLLVAYSSSLGTKEDYHTMISTLGNNFEEGFLAWGRAVSSAGWGSFEMPKYNLIDKQATVIIHNSWEFSAQQHLPPEKRWGSPFIQGKLIGIFSHAFGIPCWANDICYFNSVDPYTEIKIFPSKKTIKDELKNLRYERMMASEQDLAAKVDQKTAELLKAKKEIELHSKILEQKVTERTADLVEMNKKLQNEIETRKEAETKKELLIFDLQKTLEEVKVLRGFLPICSSCKKIRDDSGYWNQIETYISEHSEAQFSHSICPQCVEKLYGDEDWYKK
jgi:hypothetical protein